MNVEIHDAWIEAGSPCTFESFREGYLAAVAKFSPVHKARKFRCVWCQGRGNYENAPFGFRICEACVGTGFFVISEQ